MAAAGGGSTKEAKPTLGGTKFKTRKRDEKVKLDVTSFSEQLIAGLRESGGNLDEVRKFLDTAGSGQLDYRSPLRLRGVAPLSLSLSAGGTASLCWTSWWQAGCWPRGEGRWRERRCPQSPCSSVSQWWRQSEAIWWWVE